MKRLLLTLLAGMFAPHLFAASIPLTTSNNSPKVRPSEVMRIPQSLGERYRYLMLSGNLYAIPPAAPMLLANPVNADQVLVAAWNSANTSGFPNSLAVVVASSAPPPSNPTNANQVLTAVWNAAQNALNIYCVSGCGGGGGGGNVNSSGTPANHQVAIWINASTIKGLSIPASGTLFQGVSAADPAWTATPTLGVASTTTGTLGFHGAGGTGTITLTPPTTGNLGTVSIKIPPTAGTLATTGTAPITIDATTGATGCATCTTASNGQTFTNKTFDTAGTGNNFAINGTAITGVSGTGNTLCLTSGSSCSGGGGLSAPWSQSTVSIIGASTAVLNMTAAARLTPPQTAQGTTDGDLHYDTGTHRPTWYDSGAAAVQSAASLNDLSVIAPTFAMQTDGSTVTWAIGSSIWSNGFLTFTTHGGNRTLNITNPINGGRYIIWLKQDSTGGEGLILGTGCTWKVAGGGSGAITLTNSPSAVDVLSFTYDGSACYAILNSNFS